MVIASEWIIYVVSVLCQRVWAQSSAQPHSSYRPNCLTSAWHRDQLPCPPSLCYQHKLAELLQRQFYTTANPPPSQSPTVCQHGLAADDTQA